MQGLRAGKRYARALFDQAVEDGALDAVHADVQQLAVLLRDSEHFRGFVENPLVPPEARDAVFGKVAGGGHALTARFLKFLGAKKRSGLLPAVCQVFAALYREHQGVLQVKITSAHELSASQQAALSEKLKARYNKEIEIELAVDPALIGGFRIQIGDQIEDLSIAAKLQRFNQRVLSA